MVFESSSLPPEIPDSNARLDILRQQVTQYTEQLTAQQRNPLQEEQLRILQDFRLDGSIELPRHVDNVPQYEEIAGSNGKYAGRYLIEGIQLSGGGQGSIYRAWDSRLSRVVAIKVFPNKYDGARDQILQEAKILAQVESPRVCQVFDYFDTFEPVDGIYNCYIVMKYYDPEHMPSIRQLLRKEGPMAPEKVVSVIEDVAKALEEVHNPKGKQELLGIVHGDLKPDNILVSRTSPVRSDETVASILIDFGIAQETGTATAAGQGTLFYTAPDVDMIPQSDVYSLSIVAFEMLTGGEIKLFQGKTPYALMTEHGYLPQDERMRRIQDGLETAWKVKSKKPLDKLREQTVSRLQSRPVDKLIKRISAVLARGVRADSTKRYQTASELAQELTQAMYEEN